MNISKESIRNFQELYKQEFSIEITEEKAKEMATRLLSFCTTILKK